MNAADLISAARGAWRNVSGLEADHMAVLQLRKRTSSLVLLSSASAPMPQVVAKHSPCALCDTELAIYRRLRSVPCSPAPRLLGSLQSEDAWRWIFLEYIDGPEWDRNRASEVDALTTTVAEHHLRFTDFGLLDGLPDRADGYYLELLTSVLDTLKMLVKDPAAPNNDVRTLRELEQLLSRTLEVWDFLTEAARALPLTLVHGDFAPKNIRWSRNRLYAFDWGDTGGVAAPAIDLVRLNLDLYADLVCPTWSVDRKAVFRCGWVGKLYRLIQSVEWSLQELIDLKYGTKPVPWHWAKPMDRIRVYTERYAPLWESEAGGLA